MATGLFAKATTLMERALGRHTSCAADEARRVRASESDFIVT